MDSLHEWIGRGLYAVAWMIGRLPLGAQRALGGWIGDVTYRLNRRSTRVARCNVQLVEPGLSPAELERKVVAILRAAGSNAMETLRIWTRPRADNLALVREVHGDALLSDASAQGRGVILSAPHFGNWELLIEYLASREPFSLVYRVPEKRFGDVFLRLARGGENVQLVPAEANAMRPLFRALKAGQTVGITPDQQPKQGGGEFAPFFGKQALTLSLIPKLAARSGAPVVFGYAKPCPGGFAIHFEPSPATIADDDLAVATAAMNAKVEDIARRDMAHYLWTYKRFSRRPPGSGEINPYRPDCY